MAKKTPSSTEVKAAEPSLITEKKEASERFSSFLGSSSWTRQELDEMVKDMQAHPKEKVEDGITVKDMIDGLLRANGSLQDQLNMTVEQMEGMYNIGYQAFSQGNYPHAIGAFRLLCLLNPRETKYLFSLGLSLEKSKKYYEASSAYFMQTFLEETNPVPTFRTAICFLEMGQNSASKVMFRKAIKQCEVEKPSAESIVIKERAELFLSGLEEKSHEPSVAQV